LIITILNSKIHFDKSILNNYYFLSMDAVNLFNDIFHSEMN
jgi:hypothetical protein